jgi:hypothetical protein
LTLISSFSCSKIGFVLPCYRGPLVKNICAPLGCPKVVKIVAYIISLRPKKIVIDNNDPAYSLCLGQFNLDAKGTFVDHDFIHMLNYLGQILCVLNFIMCYHFSYHSCFVLKCTLSALLAYMDIDQPLARKLNLQALRCRIQIVYNFIL